MATAESLQLDGLELNSLAGDYVLIDGSLSMPPPPERPEWAQSADADGAGLVRDPLRDNRTVSFDLRVNRIVTTPAATMDDVLGLVGQISDKLQEAKKQPDGLPLVWTPAGSANSVTFDVLSGTVDDVPITVTGDGKGWFRKYPRFKVTLTCKPAFRFPEVTGPTVTTSNPVAVLTVPNVPGELPAVGRLVVTDAATQSRRHLEWGIEQRYYNAATSLEVDSGSLVTSGFAGTSTTRSGSFNTNVIRGSLLSQPIAVVGTGNLAHIGTFRVKARVYATSSSVLARLSWQDGDGPFRANSWTTAPIASAWAEIDLGLITITEATAGTQKWSGRIDAYSTASGDTLDVDYLLLIPAGEGYGKARAVYSYTPGVVVGHDEFAGMATNDPLNGRVGSGGTWATASSGFVAQGPPPLVPGDTIQRTATGDTAFATATFGSTSYSDVEVKIDMFTTGTTGNALLPVKQVVIPRWVDASNFAYAGISWFTLRGTSLVGRFEVGYVLAGTDHVLNYMFVFTDSTRWRAVRAVCLSSGLLTADYIDDTATVTNQISATSSVLATAGALASGKPGFGDAQFDTIGYTRRYDNFYVAPPAPEPIIIYSGQSAEIRSDDAIRQDAAGTHYGRVQSYRGDFFKLQPAGDAGRTSRLLVKARRGDVDSVADDHVADSTTVAVFYTERGITVPR